MGAAGSCLNQACSVEVSDWINIVAIIVNASLGFWIVRTIQNRLTNQRVLKDYFISQVRELRGEYKNCLSNLYSNKTKPQKVIPWFKLMNIKVEDLLNHISSKYKIDSKVLHPYQIELRDYVTDCKSFKEQFKSGKAIMFSEEELAYFITFQQRHSKLFDDIIIKINDAD